MNGIGPKKYILPGLTAGMLVFLIVAATLAVSPSELIPLEQAWSERNYQTALKEAEKLLSQEHSPQIWQSALRYKALCLCKLQRSDAAGFAQDAMTTHPELSEDAELWKALGDFYHGGRLAYEAHLKSAELYESQKQFDASADEWIAAGRSLVPWMVRYGPQEEPRPEDVWPFGFSRLLEIADHVAEMNVDAARKIQAMRLLIPAAIRSGDWADAQQAIGRLEKVIAEFPQQLSSSEAQADVARLYEQFDRFVEAVAAYQNIIEIAPVHSPLIAQAQERIREIRQPQIGIATDQPFLPAGEGTLNWQVRNVRTLHLVAHSIDLSEALAGWDRKDDSSLTDWLGKFATGQPVAEWDFETPDQGKHQIHQYLPSDSPVPPASGEEAIPATRPIRLPFSGAGAYWVTATGESAEGVQAKGGCLVIYSGITAVVKHSTNDLLLFVTDAVTGSPIQLAQIVAHYEREASGESSWEIKRDRTDENGLAHFRMEGGINAVQWRTVVQRGKDYAIVGPESFRWFARTPERRVYGFTDRPVYRPGQVVHFKEIVRDYQDGAYKNLPSEKLRVTVQNPRGETIYSQDMMTDPYGSVEGNLKIPVDAPLGLYSIQVESPDTETERNVKTLFGRRGQWGTAYSQGNRFRVEEYRKPEYEVTVSPEKDAYRFGQEVKINLEAKYYSGEPVSGAAVRFTIRKQEYRYQDDWPVPFPWYREQLGMGLRIFPPWMRHSEFVTEGDLETDEQGLAQITLRAEPFKDQNDVDAEYLIEAEVSDASRRVIRGSGSIKVTHQPFFVTAKPVMQVYRPGDTVTIDVKTEDPNGKPVAGKFVAEAWQLGREEKPAPPQASQRPVQYEEKLIERIYSVKIDVAETGRAQFRFEPKITGPIKVIVRQADAPLAQPGVRGECTFWVSPAKGAAAHYAYGALEMIPATDQIESGQSLDVLLNTNYPNSHVLITAEGDGLLHHQVVPLESSSGVFTLKIPDHFAPNITLTATLVRDNQIWRDSRQIIVPPTHKFLNVEAIPQTGSFGGGTDGKYQPGERGSVRIKVTDQRSGNPVVGEATVMLVDASIYYIQPEFREAIEKAFYGEIRGEGVGTSDSYANLARFSDPPLGGGYLFLAKGMMAERAMGAAMPAPQAAMMADDATAAAGGDATAPVQVRRDFRDTVLWVGTVITDEDGTADLPFALPDQLSRFALHVVAFDKDTRVGQTSTEFTTSKKITVRLTSGRFFVEGDSGYVTLLIRNDFDTKQTLAVSLKSDSDAIRLDQILQGNAWQPYENAQAVKLTIPPGEQARLDFLAKAIRPQQNVTLRAQALGEEQSDAMEISLPILRWGAKKLASSGGVLRGPETQTAEWRFTLPEKIEPGSQSLTVTLNPSVVTVALDALPYLAEYPYGCTEQTMSRFLPALMVRKTLRDSGLSLEDVRDFVAGKSREDAKWAARYERMRGNPVYDSVQLDSMIASGLRRLLEFQQHEGGWGWWREGQGDPYMTAYVVYGLCEARAAGLEVPAEALGRAQNWLLTRVIAAPPQENDSWWRIHSDNNNTRAFMLYALSRVDATLLKRKDIMTEAQRLYNARDGLTDYGRAYLALAMRAGDMKDQARIVVSNFENTAQTNERAQTVYWGRGERWWYWYDGPIETTSWVLQAMLEIDPESAFVRPAVRWLAENRRELYWGNTKATAMSVYALLQYAKAAGELDCDQTWVVSIDGSITHTVTVTRENLLQFDGRVELSAEALAPGDHSVTLRRKGEGVLYWNAYLRYFDQQEKISPGGASLAVKRQYYRLTPEVFTNTRKIWKDGKYIDQTYPDRRYKRTLLAEGAQLASGDLIEVELTVTAERNLEYMVLEDPKPAGCEPYRLVSGGSSEGGTYSNIELRDTKVALFMDYLSQGEHTITYRLVCELPGTFRVLPAIGEAMYTPFVEANSASDKMTIQAK